MCERTDERIQKQPPIPTRIQILTPRQIYHCTPLYTNPPHQIITPASHEISLSTITSTRRTNLPTPAPTPAQTLLTSRTATSPIKPSTPIPYPITITTPTPLPFPLTKMGLLSSAAVSCIHLYPYPNFELQLGWKYLIPPTPTVSTSVTFRLQSPG
jgi:hypothetical protein